MDDLRHATCDQEFWRKRLLEAHASGRGLHTAIYDTDPETWNQIQGATAGVLQRYLLPGMRLLDAGCGYGAACDLIAEGVDYVGVDLSPELIEIARLRRPGVTFNLCDLNNLPYGDHEFDFALCRSMRDMVVRDYGREAWLRIERELLRVARGIIVIEYEHPSDYDLLPHAPDEVYAPGQLLEARNFIAPDTRVLLLAGPADGNEAWTFKELCPNARVVGFEPNKTMFNLQLARGFPGELFNAALWSAPGQATFRCNGNDRQSCRTGSLTKWQSAALEYDVVLMTLDGLAATSGEIKRAFLWADVEGSELEVLRGAAGLLSSGDLYGMNLEVFEDARPAIDEFLSRYGFSEKHRWGEQRGAPGRHWWNAVYTR